MLRASAEDIVLRAAAKVIYLLCCYLLLPTLSHCFLPIRTATASHLSILLRRRPTFTFSSGTPSSSIVRVFVTIRTRHTIRGRQHPRTISKCRVFLGLRNLYCGFLFWNTFRKKLQFGINFRSRIVV